MIDLKGKKVVVTGGTGFIGSNIVNALLKLGVEVEVFKGDILDTECMRKAFFGVWAVVHQAALPPIPLSVKNPLDSHRVNVTGTLSVLVAARDAMVDRVIYASSTTIYGKNPILPKKETLIPEPCSPYSVQKLEVELNAKLFYDLYGLKSIGLRYSNVYGPGQNIKADYVPVVTKFVSLIEKGISPQIFGDGMQMRDFVFIDDVVEANILALSTEDGFGEVYNVGSGESISLIDLMDKINKILNTDIKPGYFPVRAGDNADSIIDISKAKQILKYSPKVMFDTGLKRTVESIKNNYD